MLIDVQPVHIYKAKRGRWRTHPIEEAVADAFGCDILDIQLTRCRVIVEGVSYLLPETATAFIDGCADDVILDPFSFELPTLAARQLLESQ